MARSRPTSLTDASPWEDNPRVVSLTRKILDLHEKTAAKVVTAIVAIGKMLHGVRDELVGRQWVRWCASQLPWSKSTIDNYIALSAWAADDPAELRRLARLGPSKLYLLLALRGPERRKLTGRTPVAIPGAAVKKTIGAMTVGELKRVIDGGLSTPPVPRVPTSALVQDFRHEVAGLGARVRELAERRDEIDLETAQQLRDELGAVHDELTDVFDL
jgi:hypothetical protein